MATLTFGNTKTNEVNLKVKDILSSSSTLSVEQCLTKKNDYTSSKSPTSHSHSSDGYYAVGDSSNITPLLSTTIATNCVFYKQCNFVIGNCYDVTASSVDGKTIASGYRPTQNISTGCTILYNDKAYRGFVYINTSGVITIKYYNVGTTASSPNSASKIYFNIGYTI